MPFSFPTLLRTKPDVPHNAPRWGNISGPISEQLDLVACFDALQEQISGENSVVAVEDDSYVLVLSDNQKLITIDSADAETVTVPANEDVAFPVGAEIAVARLGAGEVTIEAGVGVTVNAEDGFLRLNAQYSAASLVKLGEDTWLLVGSLKSAA